MGRGKIKREIKREKRDFHLGGMQEEGESMILPPLRRHKEYVQEQIKRKPHKKEKEKRADKRELLREKKDSQERAVCGEENKKERVKCCRL